MPRAQKLPAAITKRGDAYRVRHSYRNQITGKKEELNGTASTLAEAKIMKAAFQHEARGTVRTVAADIRTVGELLDKWMEHNQPNWSPVNIRNTENMVNTTLRPRVGDTRLVKLDTMMLDNLYRQLLKEGSVKQKKLAASTVHRLHVIMSSALGQAVKWNLIDENPAEKCTLPKKKKHKIEPPSWPDVIALIERASVTDPGFATFLTLAVATGARRGEICALRWNDFDLEAHTLRIDRALSMGRTEVVEGPTKTGIERMLMIDADAIEVIKAHRAACEERCRKCGTTLPKDAFLFSRYVNGHKPWRPDTPTHLFTDLRDKLKMTCCLHDLRHFHVTQLLAAGLDLASVAKRVGHGGGGRTTLAVYAHALQSADERAADLIGEGRRKANERKDEDDE